MTSDSFGVRQKSLKFKDKKVFIYSKNKSFDMKEPVRMSEEVRVPVDCCTRIAYNFGRWYLMIPYEVDIESKVVGSRILALDPGVRTFLTYYSSTGEQGEIGSDMYGIIDSTNAKIQSIRSKMKECKDDRKRVKHLRKSWYRMNARATNLIDDFHWKTIKFMLSNFDCIIAPKLHVSSILAKESCLQKITKKRMTFQSHYKFYTRLLYKISTTPGKICHDLEEHGTSKTCSSCGKFDKDLGSSKVFDCPSCSLRCDRDFNASKNHLVKAAFGNQNY